DVRRGDVLLDLGPDAATDEGEDDEEDRRRDGPGDLEGGVAVSVGGAPAVAVPVENDEGEECQLDGEEHRPGDVVDDVEEPIDLRPIRRYALRQPAPHANPTRGPGGWHAGEHARGPLTSVHPSQQTPHDGISRS